jgi:hypothetical protein
MPSHNQTTVGITVTEKGLGKSGSNELANIFATSPIIGTPKVGDALTHDGVRTQYQADVLDATINDAGHTFGTFDTSYTLAPDYADVPTTPGSECYPASAWVPNPNSPGEGTTNPADIPAAPDGYGITPNDTPGSGVGSIDSPATTSAKISTHTLGDYIHGESPASSS